MVSTTDGRVAWKPAARRIWMMGGRRRALCRFAPDILGEKSVFVIDSLLAGRLCDAKSDRYEVSEVIEVR